MCVSFFNSLKLRCYSCIHLCPRAELISSFLCTLFR